MTESAFALTTDETEFYPQTVTGFTGTYEQMRQTDPKQLAILQLAVKKDAKAEHVPGELELRFDPDDVAVVRYWR